MRHRLVEKPVFEDVSSASIEACFAPQLFRALFWKPRHLLSSPVTAHLPLLFWLTAAVRPRYAAVIGCDDGAAHFALCQAIDKLGLEAQCHGFGFWNDTETGASRTAPPDALLAHQEMLYEASSSLLCGLAIEDVMERLVATPADLLVVDLNALPDGASPSGEALLSCLSDEGVLVVHGSNRMRSPGSRHRSLARFVGTAPRVEFGTGDGLTALFRHDDPPGPLASLLGASAQGRLRGDVEAVFRRSGLGLVCAAEAVSLGECLRRSGAALALARKELAEAKESLAQLRTSHERRSEKIAELQVELFDLRTESAGEASTRAQLEQRLAAIAAERDQKIGALESLEAERAAERADAEARLAAVSGERDQERRARFEETAALTRIAEDLRAKADAAEAEQRGQGEEMDRLAEDRDRARSALEELEAQLSGSRAETENRLAEMKAGRDEARAEAERERQARFSETAALTRIAEELRAKNRSQAEKIAYLSNSVSWKLTAPLRRVRKLVGKLG